MIIEFGKNFIVDSLLHNVIILWQLVKGHWLQ